MFIKAGVLSVFLNAIVWFVFSPVIFIRPFHLRTADIVYLGTVSLDYDSGYSSQTSSLLPVELTKKLISYVKLQPMELDSSDVDNALALKAFDLFYPVFYKRKDLMDYTKDFGNNDLNAGTRIEDVFVNGVVNRFPDGKAYLFEPLYLYPNAYKMIIFSHKAVSNYKESICVRCNRETGN